MLLIAERILEAPDPVFVWQDIFARKARKAEWNEVSLSMYTVQAVDFKVRKLAQREHVMIFGLGPI